MADSSVTLAPNAGSFGTPPWTVVGAGDVLTATTDDLDSTYVEHEASDDTARLRFQFEDLSIPAGAVIKSVQPKIRMSAPNVAYPATARYGWKLYTGSNSDVASSANLVMANSAVQTFSSSSVTRTSGGAALSTDNVDDLNLEIYFQTAGEFGIAVDESVGLVRVYEVELTVWYNAAPVVSDVTISSVLTSTPTVSWTYTDDDGDLQERYQVRVFDSATYSGGSFNAATSTAVWPQFTTADFPGGTLSSATSVQIGSSSTKLIDNTTYRAYVRVSDAGSGGRWSDWAYAQWTTDFEVPSTPTVSAAADDANGRIALTVAATDNLLTANQSSIETDTTGWAADTNCAIAQSATQASHGTYSLTLTSSASGDMNARTPTGTSGRAVVAATQYTALASFRSAVSARSCRVKIQWYDSGGSNISTDTGSTVADSTSAFTQATVTATSPSGAAYASVIVEVVSTGAGSEVHYVDKIKLAPGASTTWTYGGFTPATINVEWTEDATNWYPVRAATAALFASITTQSGTLYDYECADGTQRTYRARITDTSETATSDASSTSAATQQLTGWWLSDPLYPSLNQTVSLRQDTLDLAVPQTSVTVEPLGRSRKLVLLGDVRGAEMTCTFLAQTAAAKTALDALRTGNRTLLLRSTTTGEKWYVRVVSWQAHRANVPGTLWLVEARLVEVDEPTETIQTSVTV